MAELLQLGQGPAVVVDVSRNMTFGTGRTAEGNSVIADWDSLIEVAPASPYSALLAPHAARYAPGPPASKLSTTGRQRGAARLAVGPAIVLGPCGTAALELRTDQPTTAARAPSRAPPSLSLQRLGRAARRPNTAGGGDRDSERPARRASGRPRRVLRPGALPGWGRHRNQWPPAQPPP